MQIQSVSGAHRDPQASTRMRCSVSSIGAITASLQRSVVLARRHAASSPASLSVVVDSPNSLERRLSAPLARLHSDAVARGDSRYTDPDTGYFVFTRSAHIARGYCCGGGCRHCPFGHVNVSRERRALLGLSHAVDGAVAQQRPLATEQPPPASTKRTASGAVTGVVYTRTGDGGTSGLLSGERRAKSAAIFDALGTVDELSSGIGAARVAVREFLSAARPGEAPTTAAASVAVLRAGLDVELKWVQERLLDCGALIAEAQGAAASATDAELAAVAAATAPWVARLEATIDAHTSALPPLTAFVLPCGGTRAAAQLHVARTVCRRAERCVWREIERAGGTSQVAIAASASSTAASSSSALHVARCRAVARFVNRLSDALFTAARLFSSD